MAKLLAAIIPSTVFTTVLLNLFLPISVHYSVVMKDLHSVIFQIGQSLTSSVFDVHQLSFQVNKASTICAALSSSLSNKLLVLLELCWAKQMIFRIFY